MYATELDAQVLTLVSRHWLVDWHHKQPGRNDVHDEHELAPSVHGNRHVPLVDVVCEHIVVLADAAGRQRGSRLSMSFGTHHTQATSLMQGVEVE